MDIFINLMVYLKHPTYIIHWITDILEQEPLLMCLAILLVIICILGVLLAICEILMWIIDRRAMPKNPVFQEGNRKFAELKKAYGLYSGGAKYLYGYLISKRVKKIAYINFHNYGTPNMTYTIVEKDFKEILNCDYYVKEQTEYRPNVGGAILGGLLDGGIGAVMGSMTNMEKLVKCELSLVIMFRDNSTIRIISPNLAGSFMKDDRRKYKKDFKKVSEMLKLVAYQNTLDSYRL